MGWRLTGLAIGGVGFALLALAWLIPPRIEPMPPATSTGMTVTVATPAMHRLRWLADQANCAPSGSDALMAGCIAERLGKLRTKAKSRQARYEALVNLDREYFRRLAEAGLVPVTSHMPK